MYLMYLGHIFSIVPSYRVATTFHDYVAYSKNKIAVSYLYLPSQVGAFPDHSPVTWHVRVLPPLST